MRQFVKYSRLKQFALRVRRHTKFESLQALYLLDVHFLVTWFILQALASTLNEGEFSDLKDQFDAIDVDKNGAISLEEMRQVTFKSKHTTFLLLINQPP
jgi:calcium-dependent protein kinase